MCIGCSRRENRSVGKYSGKVDTECKGYEVVGVDVNRVSPSMWV